jgi:hypothetical protein
MDQQWPISQTFPRTGFSGDMTFHDNMSLFLLRLSWRMLAISGTILRRFAFPSKPNICRTGEVSSCYVTAVVLINDHQLHVKIISLFYNRNLPSLERTLRSNEGGVPTYWQVRRY